jgi:hypothetical protein
MKAATLLISASLALAACGGKHADESPRAMAPTDLSRNTPAPARAFVRGADRETLVAYLRAVREVPARKFLVEWQPEVVKIDREAALDSLQMVSADGAQFRFVANDTTRALTAGKILFLWGIALRRVTGAHAVGDSWVVDTDPVSFPEVFKEADIDFDYALDTRQVFAAFRPPAPPPTASNPSAPGFMHVAFIDDARSDEAGPQIIELPNSFFTSVNGIDIELGYSPAPNGLHFDIEARKQQSDVQASTKENPRGDIEKFEKQKRKDDVTGIREGAGKRDTTIAGEADAAAKEASKGWRKTAAGGPNAPNEALVEELFGIGSALWDLRLKASGDLTGMSAGDTLSVSNQMQIHGAALGLLKTEFRNVQGRVKLQFVARRGPDSEQWIEKLKIDIPIRFNIPVIVAGLPMVFQIGFDVIAQPALTTRNDTFSAEYEIPFSGSGNVLLEGTKFTVGGTLATDPHPLRNLASSIGVSAVLVAIQAPRVGLGVGVFGASSVVYIDVVNSATITSAGSLGLAPCRQYTLDSSVNAGVDTQIAFDLPGLANFLNGPLNEKLKEAGRAASLREQIFKKHWGLIEPDVPICHPKSDG